MQFVDRRRLLQFVCLLLAVTIGMGLAIHDRPAIADDKPPDSFSLPVVVRPQETELWCWAATGEMTMEFLGKRVSQSEQANRLFKRDDCDDRPVPKPCIHGGLVILPEYGFSAELSEKPLSQQEIVRQIYTLRKPIPFGWQFPGGGGHIGLVVGYRKAADGVFLVEVVDPFPPPNTNPKNPDGGQRGFLSHKRWSGSSECTFHHALFNITEKKPNTEKPAGKERP